MGAMNARLKRLEHDQPSDELNMVCVGAKDEAAEIVRHCEATGKKRPTIIISGVQGRPE
jgi:hypothetical protein